VGACTSLDGFLLSQVEFGTLLFGERLRSNDRLIVEKLSVRRFVLDLGEDALGNRIGNHLSLLLGLIQVEVLVGVVHLADFHQVLFFQFEPY